MYQFKKKGSILIFLVVYMVLILAVTAVNAEKKTFVNGIDADYPPHAFIDEKGNPKGFDVEALDWIADEMGFEIKHQPTAWDGIIPALLAKKIDMVFSGMSITPERMEKVNFSNPYWEIDQALCVREDSDLDIINALCGKNNYTVGSQRGCTAAIWIEDNLINTGIISKDNLSLYEGFSLAVADLVNGRIDSAIMDDVMVEDAIRKGQPIKIVGTIKTGESYGVAVRKEDKELLELINEGLKRIMSSPKWEELKVKYFQSE